MMTLAHLLLLLYSKKTTLYQNFSALTPKAIERHGIANLLEMTDNRLTPNCQAVIYTFTSEEALHTA